MGFIPDITCRHCGNTYKGIFNRCPHCGTRRVKQASRPTSSTTAATAGSAAAAREGVNTRMHFIFGCVLVVAVIAAVIILINASLGGGGGARTVDISGSISWNDAASPARPGSVTVKLMANGAEIDSKAVTPAEDGSWSYSFEKLDRLDKEKQEIKYTVSIAPIADYAGTVSGYNLTLSYVEPAPKEPEPVATPTPIINSIVVSTTVGDLPDKQFAMNPGEEVEMRAVTYPMDVQCTVSWRSTDEDICTVSEDGIVTGVGPGWGSIIAYVGEVEVEILVMVRDNG